MKTLTDIYEKYKHLDILLSDDAWCADDFGYSLAADFWQAIKKALEEEPNGQTT